MSLKQFSWQHLPVQLLEALQDHQEDYSPHHPCQHRYLPLLYVKLWPGEKLYPWKVGSASGLLPLRLLDIFVLKE